MIKITIRFTLQAAALAILSSCSTTIFINKPLPPEIELEQKDQKMVIQNFFDYTRDEFVKERHEDVFRSGVMAFAAGLEDYLSESELVRASFTDTLVKSGPGRILSDLLDPNWVVSACSEYNADLLLSIDSLFIDFDWETETIRYDDGSREKTKYFYLQLQPFLTLYDKTGSLIDRSFISYEQPYSSRPTLSALITIKPNLNNATEEVVLIASDAGKDYGAKFFESMGSFPYRVYYGKPFNVAFILMQNRQWADAIRELQPFASSTDSKVAKRAANNLYVAYTGLGDEISAQMWLERSK